MAVSLDIANAFNSLPHGVIREALRYFGVPLYLRRLLEAYLVDREVAYVNGDGRMVQRATRRGVPQGSVLGPLLWNMGYDWVLRNALPYGARLICYADDTLVVARGRDWREVERLATTLVVRRIKRLNLRVALEKTEAILFHGPRRGPPPGAHIMVEGAWIKVGAHMRYLGLTLDGRWRFEPHFVGLGLRVAKAAAAVGREADTLSDRLHHRRTGRRRRFAQLLLPP